MSIDKETRAGNEKGTEYERAISDIVSGAGLIVFGVCVSYLLTFAFKVLAARYLGTTDFGVFSVGASVVSVAGLGVVGVDRAVARLLPRYERGAVKRAIIRSGAKIVLVAGLGTGALVYLASGWIAEALTSQVSSPAVIQIFSFAVPAMVLMKFFIGVTRGMKWATPKVVVQKILVPAAKLSLGTAAAMIGMGSMGFAWAFTGALVLGGTAGLIYLLRSTPTTSEKRYDFGEKTILGVALPLLVVSGSNILYTSIDTLMVGYFSTTGETGVYRASWAVARVTLVPLLGAAFIAMPTLSELHAKRKKGSVNKVYSMTVKWISLASLPVLTAFLSFPNSIMELIFGREYGAGGAELSILSVGFFTHCMMGNNEGLMISVGDEKRLMLISVVSLVMSLLLNIALISAYGAVGAAIATAATYAVMNTLIALSLYWKHEIKAPFKSEKKAVYIAIVPALATYLVSEQLLENKYILLTWIISAVVSYLLIILKFGIVSREEKKYLHMLY